MLRGLEFISGGRLEGGCPLRISRALVMRSNSALVALTAELDLITRALEILSGQKHSRRFLRELDEAPGGNNLQYIYHCVLTSLLLVTRV